MNNSDATSARRFLTAAVAIRRHAVIHITFCEKTVNTFFVAHSAAVTSQPVCETPKRSPLLPVRRRCCALATASLSSTSMAMGIIMALDAVLLIHMDRNHVGTMKPRINLQQRSVDGETRASHQKIAPWSSR